MIVNESSLRNINGISESELHERAESAGAQMENESESDKEQRSEYTDSDTDNEADRENVRALMKRTKKATRARPKNTTKSRLPMKSKEQTSDAKDLVTRETRSKL